MDIAILWLIFYWKTVIIKNCERVVFLTNWYAKVENGLASEGISLLQACIVKKLPCS